MKKISFKSQCTPQMNAKIMRGIENLICRYRASLPNGWRCCIEFQRENDDNPYYSLDLQSNDGGGEFAPVKMQMLRRFPTICGTGAITLPAIVKSIRDDENVPTILFHRLSSLTNVSELTDHDWDQLKGFGITHWYGGIRIPYEILVTDYVNARLADDSIEQNIEETRGEIRIAFSGAKEWQDVFFCFCIFERIQGILNSLWDQDQIWYNLRRFKDDPILQFWTEALNITEAPED